ncbi:hypothetical protein J6590_067275 [Homalodisca vitripennis]|nr:hypothetical protein J6590_067275 [Homalodisca vitripennis]
MKGCRNEKYACGCSRLQEWRGCSNEGHVARIQECRNGRLQQRRSSCYSGMQGWRVAGMGECRTTVIEVCRNGGLYVLRSVGMEECKSQRVQEQRRAWVEGCSVEGMEEFKSPRVQEYRSGGVQGRLTTTNHRSIGQTFVGGYISQLASTEVEITTKCHVWVVRLNNIAVTTLCRWVISHFVLHYGSELNPIYSTH